MDVAFKRGLLSGLANAEFVPGTLRVTTDEHALYLDVSDSERIRISDIVEVEASSDLAALEQPNPRAFYYVRNGNILAKYAETTGQFIQVNPDNGISRVDVTGTGNVVTGVEYDPETHTLTVTKAAAEQGDVPVYTLVRSEDSGAYAAEYRLAKDGVTTDTGVAITVPKDLIVKRGSIQTENGVTYLVVVLSDEDETELRVDVTTLIPYLTSGSAATDAVVIHIDPATHKVTASLTDGSITLEKLSSELQTILTSSGGGSGSGEGGGSGSGEGGSGSGHSHANKAVLDAITAEKVAAWDAAEQNAKDYADGLIEWGSF